jgi:hypothetical protein
MEKVYQITVADDVINVRDGYWWARVNGELTVVLLEKDGWIIGIDEKGVQCNFVGSDEGAWLEREMEKGTIVLVEPVRIPSDASIKDMEALGLL